MVSIGACSWRPPVPRRRRLSYLSHGPRLPLIAPGVVGGAVFAFVTSFDEVVLSIFLAGPAREGRSPVRIWEEIRLAYNAPSLAVGATVMLLLALCGRRRPRAVWLSRK